MEHGRRTSWTGRQRPQHASAQLASSVFVVTPRVVSLAPTSTSYPHPSPKISASGSIKAEELSRQTRVFKNAVTFTKQRTATCSNRQKIKFCVPDNLQTSSSNGSAFRDAFRPFLTGSAPQTEFALTHSKQRTEKFLTGARMHIKGSTISTPKTQKLARVKLRNRHDAHGSCPFLPGSAQEVEFDVTYSKQSTGEFLPGATTPQFGSRMIQRDASLAHSNSSNIDTKLSEGRAWLRQ
jgi:hypothetical protein